MDKKMSRREFLKHALHLGAAGSSLFLFGNMLAGCAINEKTSERSYATREDAVSIAYLNKSLGYYFFIIQQEALNRAADARGWNFEALVADLSFVQQRKQFEHYVTQRKQAIILDPIDSHGMAELFNHAKDRHIFIGVIDTPVTAGKVDITVTFDNYKGGQMAAEKIVKLLEKKYGEPRGYVLNCYGELSSIAWKLRRQGFEQTLKKYKDITLISIPTGGDIIKMHDVTIDILAKYPYIDAIHAPSETPARGIYQAMKEKGKLYTSEHKDHIIFVTIDGEPLAHQWIKEGILDASISQDPIAYSEICVELLNRYVLHGNPVPEHEYRNEKYYWEKADVIVGPSGPCLTIPPFEINRYNVNDRRLWGNIAYNEWGITYQ
ncbi:MULTISPECIES: sugar ABC transporter substrate-binding protein [Aneurinibacillus]|uniref:Sugar ABC transporter substrate-binding protein n=1 Tax=Aneurinibacillus danicus TaxID=267746 RepID=A0A511VC07_9BACL|nr:MULTISPECIES: sugar ABC transporter substrate-binding protein [Aneurinibacillus]GEN34772.1 sugar ABC transporter substrate-binding protein [Aneurinibacillus danicus]